MANLQASGAPIALVKQARRVKRLEARLARLDALEARATAAGDTDRLAAIAEEREMRAAELSFRGKKVAMAAKDYPELAGVEPEPETAED